MTQQTLLMIESAVKAVKAAMGYLDDREAVCSQCDWYTEGLAPREDECRANTFRIQVNPYGKCLHFIKRKDCI